MQSENISTPDNNAYQATKDERVARRRVYDRMKDMRDDPLRQKAQEEWDRADADYRIPIPEVDPDDWRSHLELPDAFAGIQVHMQETIDRRSRPKLTAITEASDAKEKFCNTIMNHNMDRTAFDIEYFKAKLCASIRGTAWVKDYYRVESRTIKDPTDVNDDGELVYEEKKVVDYDDDCTEWLDNQWLYWDPSASSPEVAADCIEREVISIERFRDKYTDKPSFKNIEFVKVGGDISRQSVFQMPRDMNHNEVEILHYKNRDTDDDIVVANNVVIHQSPLQTKHKELPYAAVWHYRVVGQMYGMGVPEVIRMLSEERKAIRRLNMDRQKLQLQKMFLTNTQFDIDEEDLEARPHGLIDIETNGLPLSNVIQPLEYGDVPASYFRTEEILLEDIRRAHGIDDRIQGVQTGGTATEATILKETALKRVNLIATLTEMDSLVRIGRLKWSNIQFFYKEPKYEKIVFDDSEAEVTKPRIIVADGLEFQAKKVAGKNEFQLEASEIQGKTVFKLDKKMARFMEGDLDVAVDAASYQPMSKALKQAKTTEMLTTILANPLMATALDPNKALKRYTVVNDENPDDWAKVVDDKQSQEHLADLENEVMKHGTVLAGTEGASEDHTLIHVTYTESEEYSKLSEPIKEVIKNHILEEHDANPKTGNASDLLGGFGMSPTPGAAPATGLVGPQASVQGAPAPSIQPNVAGQTQTADIGA